ncbi:LPS assembly protein LptD, partial [bacterium]|nr:LPS assembly protein LptD [bacterium]
MISANSLRNFSLTGGEIDSWDHRLRPYVEYDYVPKTNQSDLPLFDETDRVENENAVTYGFDNFFELFGDSKKNSSRDYGFFKVWESYDLRSQYTERPLTPVSLKL